MTGRGFFSLQRTLIISIASVVITYELVLLQFDADKIKPRMFDPCPMPPIITKTITPNLTAIEELGGFNYTYSKLKVFVTFILGDVV